MYSPPVASKSIEDTLMLRQDVIDQLLAIRGVDSFRPIIDNAAILLSTASSMTLRDLELYLVHEGRVSIADLGDRSCWPLVMRFGTNGIL